MRQRLGQENVKRFGWMTDQPPQKQQMAIEKAREERNVTQWHPSRGETCEEEA